MAVVPDLRWVGALHVEIAAVCPIAGISIGTESDKATWKIDFHPEATDAQKAAAQAVVAAFDPAARVAADQAKVVREMEIQDKLHKLGEAMVDDPTLLNRLLAV